MDAGKQADRSIVFQVIIALFVQQNGFQLLPAAEDSISVKYHLNLLERVFQVVPIGFGECNIDAVAVRSFSLLHLEGCVQYFVDKHKGNLRLAALQLDLRRRNVDV